MNTATHNEVTSELEQELKESFQVFHERANEIDEVMDTLRSQHGETEELMTLAAISDDITARASTLYYSIAVRDGFSIQRKSFYEDRSTDSFS